MLPRRFAIKLLLPLDPRPLFCDRRSRCHAEQEVSLASVKDDEVVQIVKKRPGTVRIDRVGSVRRRMAVRLICPVQDFTVGASRRANEADRPISVKDVDADLGDRAHAIVLARPAERRRSL